MTAVLAAALAAGAGPERLVAVTDLAMEVAARVIAVTGALPALPRSEEGRAALAVGARRLIPESAQPVRSTRRLRR